MRYILALGAGVGTAEHTIGKVSGILVDNGVANQIVVSPSGLFGGPERIVPISDLGETSQDHITLKASDAEWKAYSAFKMDVHWVDSATAPHGMPVAPRGDVNSVPVQLPTEEAFSRQTVIDDTTVVLTSRTQIDGGRHFGGLIIDTGIPEALIVADGTIPWQEVSVLDAQHIHLGGPDAAPPSADPARSH